MIIPPERVTAVAKYLADRAQETIETVMSGERHGLVIHGRGSTRTQEMVDRSAIVVVAYWLANRDLVLECASPEMAQMVMERATQMLKKILKER